MSESLNQAVQAAQNYWDAKCSNAQSDGERVEWGRRAQKMRFEDFILNHDLKGKSILDVGCGVGDFWEHLQEHGLKVNYLGIDLAQPMIDRCRERFPGVAFEKYNLLEWQPLEVFDFTVSFGIHNIRIPGGEDLLRIMTRRQFEVCREGAHLSILTDRYGGFAPHIQPWRAESVLTLALAITPQVVLRHDYLPNDFSVTLYRELVIDKRKDLKLD
jgi:SAM-dependent methyltransferase